jgi:predicted DNA-binding transcriptional regulator YafY
VHLSTRPPLARIMAIDQALRAGSWPNARTLGETLEVDPKTIRRDIALLRERLKAPIEFDPVRNGYYYSEPSFRLSYFQITEGELVALLLAEQLLRRYRGTPFGADLRRSFAKITEMLPETVSIRLDEAADCLSVMPAVETSYDLETFATLSGAVISQQEVEMTYWSAGRNETTTRKFDPYHLSLIDEVWYAIGHCHVHGDVRVFAVQRVRSVRETGERFSRPADFRIEEYMGNSFRAVRGDGHHKVSLRFPAEFACRVAEKIWHPSQSIEPTSDGGLILRFEVTDLREVKRWVMWWGRDCVEVLEPKDLREAILDECRVLLAR